MSLSPESDPKRFAHQHAFENPLGFASEFNPIGLCWIYEGVPDSYEDAAGGVGTVFSVGGAAKVAGSGEAAGPLDDEYTGASMTGGLSPGAGGVGGASASEGLVLVSAMGAVVEGAGTSDGVTNPSTGSCCSCATWARISLICCWSSSTVSSTRGKGEEYREEKSTCYKSRTHTRNKY